MHIQNKHQDPKKSKSSVNKGDTKESFSFSKTMQKAKV